MKRPDWFRPFVPALVAGSAALSLSGRALAEERGGLELRWDAPVGCPSREVVRERVRALVGPSIDNASRLHAEGEITRSNGRFRLSLRVREDGANTERVIESDSCADLAGAAAVALGLLMRGQVESQTKTTEENKPPDAGQGSSGAGSTPESTTSTPPAKEEPKPPPQPPSSSEEDRHAEPSSNDSSRTLLLLRAPLVGVDVGPLPKPSATFGLAAGLRLESFDLTLGARIGLNQTAWANDTISYGADIGRAAAELRGCYRARSRPLAVSPCLLFSVDRITARGVGDAVISQSNSVFALASGLGLVGSARLNEGWALVALLGGQVELTRAHLVAGGLGEIRQLSAFAFAASAGVEWNP